MGITRPILYKYIDRGLGAGLDVALSDKYHRPKAPVITMEAKSWVINLACTKPKDHGYAAEMWTLSSLAKHTRRDAPKAGHVSLSQAAKATIQRILKSQSITPHKMKYYLERRDKAFDQNRLISQRKPWHSWPPVPIDSFMSTHPSTAPG